MGKRLRLAVATALVAIPAGTGLGMVPGFAAEEAQGVRQTAGGCWTYVPGPEGPTGDPAAEPKPLYEREVLGDVSGELMSWSPSDEGALLDMRSSGANVDGGKRVVELTVEDGPVLSTEFDVTGTATAHFVVSPVKTGDEVETPDELESRVVSVVFEAAVGESVAALEFQDSFEIQEGAFRVDLRSLYFQTDETPDEVTVCNGQSVGEPTLSESGEPGVNPATWPINTEASVEFEAMAAVTLTLGDVRGQQETVTNFARAGDVMDVRVAGLESGSEFRLDLMGATTLPLSDENGVAAFAADGDGRAELLVVVPANAPTQAVRLEVVQSREDGDSTVIDIPVTILDSPRVAATEKANDGSLEVALGGAEWDPLATVTVVPMAGDAPSEDAPVEFRVGEAGVFSESLTLTDEATDALAVTQERADGFEALGASYALVNVVGAPPTEPRPTPPAEPTTPPAPTTQPVPTTPPTAELPPSVSLPPVLVPELPPVEVPLPDELPIDAVDAQPVPEVAEEVLQVSEVTLAGDASLGELFGGPSRRDVRILVENAGATLVSNPLVRLGVGRDGDVQPALVAAEVGDLQPGARVMVSVDVSLPMASFGTYQVVGQVGESDATRFQLRWDTYPWGLIVLNFAGVALLAWGVARRRKAIVAPPLGGAQAEEEGASVIDLHALDEWWVRGRVARVASPTGDTEDDNDSVVDLDAAEKWWAKRGSKVS